MDTPPPLPEPKPLGPLFYILLLGPIALMAIAALVALAEGRNRANDWSLPVSLLALPVMLVCSIICAVMVGRRKSVGYGFLTFLGIQVVYIGVAFAGCATVLDGMSFH